jgi:hypothetical protein
VSGNTATVQLLNRRFRAKLFGLHGAKAVNHVYLAIPLDARVYGKSPRGKPVSGMFPITIKRTRARNIWPSRMATELKCCTDSC